MTKIIIAVSVTLVLVMTFIVVTELPVVPVVEITQGCVKAGNTITLKATTLQLDIRDLKSREDTWTIQGGPINEKSNQYKCIKNIHTLTSKADLVVPSEPGIYTVLYKVRFVVGNNKCETIYKGLACFKLIVDGCLKPVIVGVDKSYMGNDICLTATTDNILKENIKIVDASNSKWTVYRDGQKIDTIFSKANKSYKNNNFVSELKYKPNCEGNYTFKYSIDLKICLLKWGGSTVHNVNVCKKDPIINWCNPKTIEYGTPLSNKQLNASADVDGTFTYTPSKGELLNAGSNQALTVLFTPTNTEKYNSVSKTVYINVKKAPLKVFAMANNIEEGQPAPNVFLVYKGFKGNDDASVLDNSNFILGTTYTLGDPAGIYKTTIALGCANDNNYFFKPLIRTPFKVKAIECTTEEPTTDECNTEEPTTDECTTEEPTTDECTTEEPTTDECTTEEPTTDECTTEEPTTDECTTEEPTTDECTTEEPTTDECTTEEPTTDECTTEEPTTDECTTEEPTTDECTTEEPTTDECTTEKCCGKKCKCCTTEEPATEQPTTDIVEDIPKTADSFALMTAGIGLICAMGIFTVTKKREKK